MGLGLPGRKVQGASEILALNCTSGKLVTKANFQAQTPEIQIQLDTEGPGPTEPLPRRPAPLTATRPVVSGLPESHLNMTVSQARGASQGVWGPRGEWAGHWPGGCCVHATQANLLRPAGCRPLTFPGPAGQLLNECTELLGDAPCGNVSPCSYLGLLGPTSKFSSVAAENWANRAQHWGGEAPRG